MRKYPHWTEVLTLGLMTLILITVRATKTTQISILMIMGFAAWLHVLSMLLACFERRNYVCVNGILNKLESNDFSHSSPHQITHASSVFPSYSYIWNGMTHKGTQVTLRPWSFRAMAGDSSLLFRIKQSQLSDHEIEIYVNKHNPRRSVLTLAIDMVAVYFFGVAGAILIGVSIFFY
jgi:hypothetical protein